MMTKNITADVLLTLQDKLEDGIYEGTAYAGDPRTGKRIPFNFEITYGEDGIDVYVSILSHGYDINDDLLAEELLKFCIDNDIDFND